MLFLTIISPEKILFKGNVENVLVPGELGEFEILSVCFSKEDIDIGSLRKIGLLENKGRVHDIMYFFFLREKK